jgi:sporulation integral membrane protein YtvI
LTVDRFWFFQAPNAERRTPSNEVTCKLKITAWLAALGIGLLLGVKYVIPVVTPFLLGILFASLIEPLVMWCETRLRLKRAWTVPGFLILVLVLVLTLVTVTLVLTYQEAQHLWKLIPGWAGRLTALAQGWLARFNRFIPEWQQIVPFFLKPELFSQMSRPLLLGLVGVLPRFPQIAALILLGVVSAYFFSRDKRFFLAVAASLIPTGWQRPAFEFQTEVVQVLNRFFRLQCGLILNTMALTFICLSLLGINGALAYGLLAGFFDLAPVLGPGLIYLPIMTSCLLMGNYTGAAGVVAVYFLLLLIRQVAELKICGAGMQIHPLLSLIVIYLGMKWFGLIGFFAGPMLLMVLRSCYRVLLKYEVNQQQGLNDEKDRDFRLDRFDRSADTGSNPGISGAV